MRTAERFLDWLLVESTGRYMLVIFALGALCGESAYALFGGR